VFLLAVGAFASADASVQDDLGGILETSALR
jgi:hypothetical protein